VETAASASAGPAFALARGGRLRRTRGYAWRDWNAVTWHERRKAGFPIVRRAFARVSGITPP